MPDMEPACFVVTESCRARRWKFWKEMHLHLVSDLGFGVPVRSGVDMPCANIIPGVCVVEGAFCDKRLCSWDPHQVGQTVGGCIVYLSSSHRSSCRPIG